MIEYGERETFIILSSAYLFTEPRYCTIKVLRDAMIRSMMLDRVVYWERKAHLASDVGDKRVIINLDEKAPCQDLKHRVIWTALIFVEAFESAG